MPTSRRLAGVFAALAALALPAGGSGAGEVSRLASAENILPQRIAAVSGDTVSQGSIDLELAAERGGLEARLKLARKYASGDGVPRSSSKAFNLYQRIVDDHAEIRASEKTAMRVAQAFVALGNYYRTGIAGTTIKANKHRALTLFWHAASYLGDADAQCNLALMLLEGEGIARNGQLAVNWLANAAKKRHARAQAILGDILLRGASDIRRQPQKGLALLTLARQNAGTKKETHWIAGLLADAEVRSSASERKGAARLVALWEPHYGQQVETVVLERKAPAQATVTKLAPASTQGGLTQVGLRSAPAPR